jgi:hypothetical protein
LKQKYNTLLSSSINRFIIFLIPITSLIFAQPSSPSVNISVPSGIDIEISGEAELEFINVEGAGGASNEDDFLKKIETRSPYTRIDKAVLEFKILYSENIKYVFGARFDDNGAYADKHYLRYIDKHLRIEIGKNRPTIALKRATEGYPLIGTAYWKGRQYHLDVSNKLGSINIGGSFALKRPLGYDDAAEDNSFNMLVYDDAEKIDGQTWELGLRGALDLSPIKFQGWYYYGKLIDDEDWKKRLHYDFDYYVLKEADDVLTKDANIDHYWYGGRAEVNLMGSLFRGEYIASQDGFLPRDGFYVEGRRKLSFGNNSLLALARYGELRIDYSGDTFYPLLKDPQTWNRKMTTLALIYDLTDFSKVKIEYYILDEQTGDTIEKAENQNRRFQQNVLDNQFLVQIELSF